MGEIDAYKTATPANRPKPPDDEAAARWKESSLRNRMLHGGWSEDARRVLQSFYDEATYAFLPDPVKAFNPFKEFVEQTSTLYDEPVTLHFQSRTPAAAALAMLGLTRLWAQMQDVLRNVRGMRECFVRRSWDADLGQVRYRIVTADCVLAYATGSDPQQPTIVWELRKRRGITADGFDPDAWYWCWDVWDFSRPGQETFSILHDSGPLEGAKRVDITLEIRPDVADLPGRLPYWSEVDTDGAPAEGATPIWPWTAYHHRVSSELWEPFEGVELVDGTLIVTTLWTNWVGGFRDVAHAQRYMLDADIVGAKPTGEVGPGIPFVAANPMMVLKLRSTKEEGGGSAGEWRSPMDPATAAKSIADFAASLALHAGLSPADVSVGNSGLSRTSGFAIEVSRSGVRRVEGQIVTPMLLSDQHNLASAAQLANAYGGRAGKLPTDPGIYLPVYGRQGKTPDEIRAETEEALRQVETGLLHPRDAVRKLHPEMTEAQAEEYLIQIAQFNKRIASISVEPAPATALNEPDDEDDTTQGDEPEETEDVNAPV